MSNGLGDAGWVALVAIVPLVALMLTCFVKVSVVLSLLRNAIGATDAPSGLVVMGLSLVLTFFVMAPVAVDMVAAARVRPVPNAPGVPTSPARPAPGPAGAPPATGAATGAVPASATGVSAETQRGPAFAAGTATAGTRGSADGATAKGADGSAETRAPVSATSAVPTKATGGAAETQRTATPAAGAVTASGAGVSAETQRTATPAAGTVTASGADVSAETQRTPTPATAVATATGADVSAETQRGPAGGSSAGSLPVAAKPLELEAAVRTLVPAQHHGTLDTVERALGPLRTFLGKHASERDRATFLELAGRMNRSAKGDELWLLAPAFLTTELREAFAIAVLIFIPFLVIDLLVGLGLAALGLATTSPQTVALPFKLLLFVAVDGWRLLVDSLLKGYV